MLSSICLKLKSYISCNICFCSDDLKFFRKKAKCNKNKLNRSEKISVSSNFEYSFLLVVKLIKLL